MPAILAKKLGMTQRFTEEGRVERVTVLEAGPCPVTAIRTLERDGYEAVQLAFGQTREKHLSKPELGHLKKADAPPLRRLAEFRGEVGELTLGEVVTVESFEVGSRVKVSGTSKGKGFQGTIKRHNFASGPKSHGSHNVRAPGSIGAKSRNGSLRPVAPRPRKPVPASRILKSPSLSSTVRMSGWAKFSSPAHTSSLSTRTPSMIGLG